MHDQKETFEFDVIIIGAGIVGLAIAHGLMNQYENILIVEKESTFGRHVSSRNSEVIHSGFYYEPNSLKANLCVKGNKLLYDFSRKYKIDHRNCGKYIIATIKEDIHKLEHLMKNGEMNGLEGMKLLTANEIKKREPLINSVGGLWIPSSGIIDSHGIMQKLEFLIQSNDAKIVYNTEVTDICHEENFYILSFKDLDYQAKSKIVINSGGLWCDEISQMAGINDYQLNYCKGEYYKTSKLFVLPSLYEGFGNSLVEAMSFGVPCISTSNSGGPKEILCNGKYGYLVNNQYFRLNFIKNEAKENTFGR